MLCYADPQSTQCKHEKKNARRFKYQLVWVSPRSFHSPSKPKTGLATILTKWPASSGSLSSLENQRHIARNTVSETMDDTKGACRQSWTSGICSTQRIAPSPRSRIGSKCPRTKNAVSLWNSRGAVDVFWGFFGEFGFLTNNSLTPFLLSLRGEANCQVGLCPGGGVH